MQLHHRDHDCNVARRPAGREAPHSMGGAERGVLAFAKSGVLASGRLSGRGPKYWYRQVLQVAVVQLALAVGPAAVEPLETAGAPSARTRTSPASAKRSARDGGTAPRPRPGFRSVPRTGGCRPGSRSAPRSGTPRPAGRGSARHAPPRRRGRFGARRLHHSAVLVRGQDVQGRALRRRFLCLGLRAGLPPGAAGDCGQDSAAKRRLPPRGQPETDHGGLDGDGAGAAERVGQRAGRVPAGEEHQRRGQGLAQRRLPGAHGGSRGGAAPRPSRPA